MDIKDLSIIITTFKSEAKIHSCLNSLPKTLKTYVIENSNNKEFKKEIEKSHSSVECILTGSNKGYSVANNIGLSKIKSKYALILNPDTIVAQTAIQNFLVAAKKNPDFWLIGPDHDQNTKSDFKKNKIYEVENLKGFAIFFNIEKFDQIFFDENFFLYFEEIDLCKRVKLKNGKIFLDPNIRINHEGGTSVDQNLKEKLEKNRNWHWMWSTFYFHKKYKGFLMALIIIFPKLFSSFCKIIFYQIIFDLKKRDIYFCRLSGIINSIIGNKSWYRPTLD
jgi:N-acetylglucosaminyl-diphospho-decaprenol L-rhamnosyltransferase